MGFNPPPVPTDESAPPPLSTTVPKSASTAYERMVSKFPALMRQWTPQVFSTIALQASRTNNDPIELLTILLLTNGQVVPRDLRAQARDFGRLMERRGARGRRNYDTLDDFIKSEILTIPGVSKYNRAASAGLLLGTYKAQVPELPPKPLGPKAKARRDKRFADAREDLNNPVVVNVNGADIRANEWARIVGQFDDLTRWYQGRRLDPVKDRSEIIEWLETGKSTYQISVELSRDPRFFRSPAWKGSSLKYKTVFRDLIGAGAKPDKNLIRKAIIRNWTQAEYGEALRERPEYLKSNEFQSATSRLQNIYSKIFGGPITSGVKNAVQEAAIHRWSDDQFATWLRGQPEYATSVEFQRKRRNMRVTLADAFGVPLSRFTKTEPVIPPAAFELPDSARIEGAPGLTPELETEFVPQGSTFPTHGIPPGAPGPPPRR